jgi:hypothetical protein
MAEGKGEYGGLLSEIRSEQMQVQSPALFPVLLPEKRPVNTGKRSDPAYIQRGALKNECVAVAN